MHHDLLEGLTEPQRQAVAHTDGPLLILAGPGSGKTRVITRRVAYLVHQGIPAHNILAITFTNKAAQEMKERVLSLDVPRGVTICTFHALAARLLREFHDLAQLPANFSIYDTADQKAAMREALKVAELDSQNFPPVRLLNRVSNYKNDLKLPEHLENQTLDFVGKATLKAYRAYQQQLQANGAVDFDDLLMKLAFLLRDEPELRQRLNERYRYVMVDEYQDTNHCQYQIARGLALDHSNLCVTGDPDQSIYGWRGADIQNILAFEEDYPQATVVRLEENFRSTPQVLALADQLIQQNSQRKHKKLFTSKSSGADPVLKEYQDEHDEARGIVQYVKEMQAKGYECRQMAVFYRVNSMSRVLEESFRREHVPYQIVRGVEFFQRKEIKDMIAYLRLLANPDDQISLQRVINQPARGIGATTVGRLLSHARDHDKGVGAVLDQVDFVDTLNASAKKKVAGFAELLHSLRARLDGSVEDLMRAVYIQSGLQAALKADKSEEPAQNVDELISSAAEYDAGTETPSLVDYLEQIALVSDSDAYDENSGAVSLMTLHAAKGLEFPVVWVAGIEDGLLPHRNSKDTKTGLEEERRLLFVGMTRAQEHLAMSYARNRTFQGMSLATIRSEFLRGLDGLEVSSSRSEMFSAPSRMTRSDELIYEPIDAPEIPWRKGQLVRHPSLGVGRIQEIMPSRENSRVIVQFTAGPRKTLVLKYARLEAMD